MRVCDRCGDPAVDEILFKMDDGHFDVCPSCRQIVFEALRQPDEEAPQKRRGRPPKNLGTEPK